MTAQALIDAALLSINAVAPGESPSATERDDGLVALNHIVASWNAQALPIYQITRSTVALTGAASYPLNGASRPMKIKAAAVVASTAVSIPLLIATPDQWAAYVDKAGTADYGEILFYEDGYPLGKIHLAPKSNGTLELISEKVIGSGLMKIRETLNLTGAASYTMGVGGVFATERPARVLAASIAAGSSIARPVRLISAEEWAAYPKRGVAGNFAEVAFYDNAYPNATLWLGPKPVAGGSLELFSYMKLAGFATLATVIDLPDGYERALRLTLAIELAPEYGRRVPPELVANANDAKLSIFGLNASILGHPNGPPPAAPPAPPAPAPREAPPAQPPEQQQ